jgi:ketosteroid isomerase-like protein
MTDHHPDDSTHPRVDVLRRAVAAISALDADTLATLLHEDLLFQLPYETRVADLDKAGFLELLRTSSFTLYQQFTISLTHIFDLVDESTLIARYEGDCIGHDGVEYRNNYVGIFAFRDELISSWREYDDPQIVIDAQERHAQLTQA